MLGLPFAGHPVTYQWALTLPNLHPPMNYDVRWCITEKMPVDQSRNFIKSQAQKQKCKYLFFLGDDVTIPPHAIRQLIFHMEHNPKIGVIGAIYCHKSEPSAPLVFRGNGIGPYWDWKAGELFRVSGIGMDAALIRVEVLDKLPDKCFVTYDSIEPMLEGINKAENWTEDLWFCKQVEDLGYEVWADGSLICGHWDWQTGKMWSLPANSKPMMRAGVQQGHKKIIDLGCGDPEHSYKTPEGEPLRVDLREEVQPDYRCDIRKLPFGTGEFDIVFSSHTLEHFSVAEVPDIMDEWTRILKPGGEMRLMLPNLEWAARQIMNGEVDNNVMNVLYGKQSYDLNYHKVGFTPGVIQRLLVGRGFKHFVWDFHTYNMLVRAWKEKPAGMLEDGTIPEGVPDLPIIKLVKSNMEPTITLFEPKPVKVDSGIPEAPADFGTPVDPSAPLPSTQDLDNAAVDYPFVDTKPDTEAQALGDYEGRAVEMPAIDQP